ncbi:mechanosensitive ion channel domain-containing protein [uncultured Sunxiuqinia sp.]|uniref:mechanosensitive ion channel domain-containing protein n=1 Tax=Sunxiuqinia rutila TaxID=1397841 RepID=UPI00262C93FA|nr:mechanosensitive ion channel domain-containing protein [uncultured Sunxiuqinia sp.]
MDAYKLEIMQTAIVLALLLAIRFVIRHSINRTLKKFNFTLQRRRITIKMMNFFIILGTIIAVTGIWGIEREKLMLFLSSVLTIIGIAFFAQWSILANITSGLILYFNHPMKLGDHIKILEKDFIIEGQVNDVTFFFVHLISPDGDRITIPNSIILQKNISVEHPDNKKSRSKS